MLIEYFDYFCDRLWEGGGKVVLIVENKVVFPGKYSGRLSLNFSRSFICPPVFDLLPRHLPSLSACSWSPLALCPCQSLRSQFTCLPEPAETQRGATRKNFWQGTRVGHLRALNCPTLCAHKIPDPTLSSPSVSKYQQKIVPLGSGCSELGEGRGRCCTKPGKLAPPL